MSQKVGFHAELPQSTDVDRVSPAGSVGAIRMPPACRTPLKEGAFASLVEGGVCECRRRELKASATGMPPPS